MNKLKKIIVVTLLTMFSIGSQAFTAIADVTNHIKETFSRSSNYSTQKEADITALRLCREQANDSGLTKLAKSCKVTLRGKGPGYGALSCGTEGCAYNTGHASEQEAVDTAYTDCTEAGYTNCNDSNISTWKDFEGFAKVKTAAAPVGDCRPRTAQIRCSSSCNNGACVIKYENGCTRQVQVQPQFNPFNNQWTYPSPSC